MKILHYLFNCSLLSLDAGGRLTRIVQFFVNHEYTFSSTMNFIVHGFILLQFEISEWRNISCGRFFAHYPLVYIN